MEMAIMQSLSGLKGTKTEENPAQPYHVNPFKTLTVSLSLFRFLINPSHHPLYTKFVLILPFLFFIFFSCQTFYATNNLHLM